MLKGKVALITGAGKGIGAAIAKEMAAQGAFVIINYSRSKEQAMQVKASIEAAGGQAAIYGCDVSDSESVKNMIADVIKEHKCLDILVNNAGMTKDGLLMRMKEEDFDQVLDVNLKGTFNCIQNASRYMMKQKNGRILNISSVVGLYGNAGQVNYSASKAGIIGLTKSVAKELGSRGITANAIAPGFIQTEMTDVLSEDVKAHMRDAISLGCFGPVEDIAHAAVFLTSDQARYITGQVLCVDGGIQM